MTSEVAVSRKEMRSKSIEKRVEAEREPIKT